MYTYIYIYIYVYVYMYMYRYIEIYAIYMHIYIIPSLPIEAGISFLSALKHSFHKMKRMT